ncbi:FAD-dependent oxidoreductase [Gluconacetobacter azotocaptans]|uniref:FAD-dependent oxidoreductase n=1 Tax=Gluconacetobacter azotocaptans TaxID=142834 RepID=UPI00195BC9F3|nr:FAD-dependent oxidoreductase [Gluconacetobacter azotocaptans]MBM9399998.1 FAD-dependent oxidoreductase [Gluconacetobacter azotocaptans]
MSSNQFLEPARNVPVLAAADVVVVGGGPAGFSAAVAAAREGASVCLIERYASLGGLASGGMVLVLDDMCAGAEITVRGICATLVERMRARGLAVYPPEAERGHDPAMYRKWSRWGLFDFNVRTRPHPICYAVAFDPEGWKQSSLDMVGEGAIDLRLHTMFSGTIVRDGRVEGVIVQSKEGRGAIMAGVVIDATGDLDVAAGAGAAFSTGSYIITTVFRLGGVDTDEAERFQYEEPERYAALDLAARRIIGGSWDYWWLKTPLPGIVWCNCPHMTGLDGLSVADLTRAEIEGRRRIQAMIAHVRENLPGFAKCYLVDVASQTGVRQTRMLDGDYVVTKEDITGRVHFADSVARGRDYYTPYRALLPRGIDNLLVAGRHYSATPMAQKISREIPPCMAMGEAAGTAAAMALSAGTTVRDLDVAALQARLRAHGADPGAPSTLAGVA